MLLDWLIAGQWLQWWGSKVTRASGYFPLLSTPGMCHLLTCNNNPLRNLHQCRVSEQGLLKWQGARLVLWGHFERLRYPHSLADALCVLQLIMDAVHLRCLRRGGGEGWPTHPAWDKWRNTVG